MKVHFIGAGPGAADLLTLRGRDLISQSPICIYAGSLINPEILQFCPADARRIDSAALSLEDLEQEFLRAQAENKNVARLHSGDLSIWSAVNEQIRLLERHGIDYVLTPGVPAFAAAAASLRQELTLPQIAQSVVLTRTSGRASPMPPQEKLAAFAETGALLAVHLSIHVANNVAETLLPFYGESCPVAVVFRASWTDERIIRTNLGNLTAALASAPIERSALIFVGPSLGKTDFSNSSLYDASYQRRFRGRA